MSESIKSRPIKRGNPCEATWLSDEPSGDRGIFHIDRETGELKPGYPPNPNPQYGIAPCVIFDSMPAEYHEAAGRTIESRKEWELADKQHGTVTFSSREEPHKYTEKGKLEAEVALKKDRRKASLEAIQAYKENPTEVKQKLEKTAEEQIKVLKKAGMTKKLKEAVKV